MLSCAAASRMLRALRTEFFCHGINDNDMKLNVGMTRRGGMAACVWLLAMAASSASLAQEIVLGQSVALSGAASELGREMRLGAQLYFDELNAKGGVRGKKIVLRTLDDGYEANRAVENTRKFVADGDVHAMFGYVGTPTSLPSIPIATEARIPFFRSIDTCSTCDQVTTTRPSFL
jgi:ABC-type branched-subunit amino acid transport system substrate-binding protein